MRGPRFTPRLCCRAPAHGGESLPAHQTAVRLCLCARGPGLAETETGGACTEAPRTYPTDGRDPHSPNRRPSSGIRDISGPVWWSGSVSCRCRVMSRPPGSGSVARLRGGWFGWWFRRVWMGSASQLIRDHQRPGLTLVLKAARGSEVNTYGCPVGGDDETGIRIRASHRHTAHAGTSAVNTPPCRLNVLRVRACGFQRPASRQAGVNAGGPLARSPGRDGMGCACIMRWLAVTASRLVPGCRHGQRQWHGGCNERRSVRAGATWGAGQLPMPSGARHPPGPPEKLFGPRTSSRRATAHCCAET